MIDLGFGCNKSMGWLSGIVDRLYLYEFFPSDQLTVRHWRFHAHPGTGWRAQPRILGHGLEWLQRTKLNIQA
jgi:hypothetical protein